jgi:hypothetical protein
VAEGDHGIDPPGAARRNVSDESGHRGEWSATTASVAGSRTELKTDPHTSRTELATELVTRHRASKDLLDRNKTEPLAFLRISSCRSSQTGRVRNVEDACIDGSVVARTGFF